VKYCVVYKDERDGKPGMGLCIDLDDPSPAMRYSWTRSASLITAFDSKEQAQRQGIEKCGQGEMIRGVKVLHIMPHPNKRYRNLKPLKPLRIA
jgi:hypothetical protein